MGTRGGHEQEWLKLSEKQRAAWLGFLRAHSDIVKDLDAELHGTHQLPLSSFDVLVQLSLSRDGRLRMSQCAERALLSRSGLTRLVERLERQGFVVRERDATDARAIYARITRRGLEKLAVATPTHLDGVRRRFLDKLSEDQMRQLIGIWGQLLDEP